MQIEGQKLHFSNYEQKFDIKKHDATYVFGLHRVL